MPTQHQTLSAILDLCHFLDQQSDVFSKKWIGDPHNSIGEYALVYDYRDDDTRNDLPYGVYKLPVNIDAGKLWEAHLNLKADRWYQFNFTEDQEQMLAALNTVGTDLLPYLKIYNRVADDYPGMAALINTRMARTRMASVKYGL